MTPRELAEKILGIVRNPETIDKYQYEMAESLLAEAMEEAKKSVDVEHEWNLGYLAGKSQAYEHAAKIAEGFIEPDYAPDYFQACADVAEAIRHREKEN